MSHSVASGPADRGCRIREDCIAGIHIVPRIEDLEGLVDVVDLRVENLLLWKRRPVHPAGPHPGWCVGPLLLVHSGGYGPSLGGVVRKARNSGGMRLYQMFYYTSL